MRISIVAIILITVSCSSTHTVVQYQNTEFDKIRMKIPKNYVFEGVQGDHELEHRYWYPDSSVIYITTFENTMNYEYIRDQGSYYDRFTSLRSKDSLTLKGISENGLYWKDILLKNGITIGYSRVPQSRLRDFNLSLLSTK